MKQLLSACIHALPLNNDEIFESVYNIFHHEETAFYVNFDDSVRFDVNDENQDYAPFMVHDGKYAALPISEYSLLAPHYVELINHFCEVGGIDALIQ
jgi:hypothetical protein